MNYRILKYYDFITKLQFLSKFQKKKSFSIHVKDIYTIIQFHNYDYHITIYQDQWDDYKIETKLPYYLFHITSGHSSKCSTYFWVDIATNLISPIPDTHFQYNQTDYDFYRSTRSPCDPKPLKYGLKRFQKLILCAANIII